MGANNVSEQYVIPVPANILLNNELGDKRAAAYISMVVLGVRGKDISEAVEQCGYSSHRGKGSVLAQFRRVEQWLKSNDYFHNVGYSLKPYEKYGLVKICEFSKIVIAKGNHMKMNIADVLLVLSWIRVNTHYGYDVAPGNQYDVNQNFKIDTVSCYGYIKEIAEQLGISRRKVTAALDVLKELGIVSLFYEHSINNGADGWRTRRIRIEDHY